ncbi:hypothetical protein M0G74_14165 [Microbulbifer sp. CAU 1566]|uniref:hypothetical protein n=1 Tax=Microbulbifer sp. CAU 1566 TaxID=2933269 RepID=UPI002005F8E3|nr:hypothetical protein [Microbulbifer sp. CAU 1566]MCK7598421.1 hypothetical protein [Microbulbifer sp. CAU 1566]
MCKFNLSKLASRFLLILTLLSPTLAHSQGCNGNLDACGFPATVSLNSDRSQTTQIFTVRSRQGRNSPRDYYLQLTQPAATSGNFLLYPASGEGSALQIEISFQAESSGLFDLSPTGIAIGPFGGTQNETQAALIFSVTPGQTITDSYYEGGFQLNLMRDDPFSPGTTTQVSFIVAITVAPTLQLKSLGPVDLSNAGIAPGQPLSKTEDFCVGGAGFSEFTVNLSSLNGSSGAGGGIYPYTLIGQSSGEQLSYSVAFTDDFSDQVGTEPTSSGDITTPYLLKGDADCSSDTARIIVTVEATEWGKAVDSIYTDILTVTVTSN